MAESASAREANPSNTESAAREVASPATDPEAAMRHAGLKRFRLIRPSRAARGAPGATTVLPPPLAAGALASPAASEADPVPTVVLPSGVASRALMGAAATPGVESPRQVMTSPDAPIAEPSILAEWVSQLGRMTRDLHTASVFHVPAAGAVTSVAAWPRPEADESDAAGLARRAIESKKYLVGPARADPGLREIALPLVLSGLPRHAVVARIARPPGTSVSADLKPLLQASAWLKPLLAARLAPATAAPPSTGSSPERPAALREALDLLATTLEQRELLPAATALVNRLAALLSAGRVSLGLLEASRMRLLAVSGSAAFDPATSLSSAVRDAMGEALRQGTTLAVPSAPGAAPREDSAQRALLREARCGAVCSVPFAAEQRAIGAVTIEWPEGTPVDAALHERAQLAHLALVHGAENLLGEVQHGGDLNVNAPPEARR